jgi:hypothetical protein
MQTEIETIKVIHISNQGFDWRIVVKDDPEFPELLERQKHEKYIHPISNQNR